ncbi:MAG: hypothetical protein Q8O40_10375 [Chloroflexota bacterium]|nr:hypothetical protein [Chloroflexota bacterium]
MNPLQPLAEGFVNNLAALVPLGFAFGAGMVATVNPCGFALLPAYISLYLGGGPDAVSQQGVVVRLLWRLLPWVERVSAVLIIAAGGYIIYYWLTIGRDLLLS